MVVGNKRGVKPIEAVMGDFPQKTHLHQYFAVYMGKLYKAEYRYLLRNEFVSGKALTAKNEAKAVLFSLHPQIYVKAVELKEKEKLME